mmetsp:Transcript_9380/g.28479  ORF Transcript_9380/g.28479 Transcript_9380/m.28479 type:complete len:486 (+) Transcript_9380:3390-4847(+)
MPSRSLAYNEASLPARVFDRSLSGRALCAEGEPLLPLCPPGRTQPVIADDACAVLSTVLLGFSADGARLISYSSTPCISREARNRDCEAIIWGQCWSFSPGEPLVLLCEAPLFEVPQEVYDTGLGGVRLSCFEVSSERMLVYHIAYRLGHTGFSSAVSSTCRFESVCIMCGEEAWCSMHSQRDLLRLQRSSPSSSRTAGFVAYENVESHGPFLSSSWALNYLPSAQLLLWNVGDGIFRIDLSNHNSCESGKGLWRANSTLCQVRGCEGLAHCTHLEVERWFFAILARLQLTHLDVHDYSLLPIGDVSDDDSPPVLLLLLYLQLHTKVTSDDRPYTLAAMERSRPSLSPPAARRTAICVALTAPLIPTGKLRVLHAEKAPIDAPSRWLDSKLHELLRELPPSSRACRGSRVAHALQANVSVLSNASVATGKSLSSLSHPILPIAVAGFQRSNSPRGTADTPVGALTNTRWWHAPSSWDDYRVATDD